MRETATTTRRTELRTRLDRVDEALQQWERVQQWAALPDDAPRPPGPARPALTRQTLRELRALLLEELTHLEEST